MFDRPAAGSRAKLGFLASSLAFLAAIVAATDGSAAINAVSFVRDLSTFAIADPVGDGDPLFELDEVRVTTGGFFSDESISLIEVGTNSIEGLARQATSIEDNSVVGTGSFRSGAVIDFDEYEFAEGFGSSRLFYEFEVDTPTHFAIIAALSASGLGSTHLTLQGPNSYAFLWSIQGGEQIDVASSGILEPGLWTLRASSGGYGQAVAGLFTPSSGIFHFELGFDEPASVPTVAASFQNVSVFPNPTRDHATIDLRSVTAVVDEIEIVNVAGQVVRKLRPTGSTADWDTRNEQGEKVAPGIYFVRSGREMSGRITVLR